MSHKLVKCMKCGKTCMGRLCRKCYSSKKRGQLSRLPSLRPKDKMKDPERKHNKKWKKKENKKFPYRKSRLATIKLKQLKGGYNQDGSKEKSTSKESIRQAKNKVATSSKQNLERNEETKS